MVILYDFWAKIDRSIVSSIKQSFDADIGVLTLQTHSKNKIVHLVSSKYSDEPEVFEASYEPDLLSSVVMKTGKPLHVSSIDKLSSNARCPIMLAEDCKAYCGIPIRTGKVTIGAIQLIFARETDWSVDTLESLEQFAIPLANYLDSDVPNALSKLRRN